MARKTVKNASATLDTLADVAARADQKAMLEALQTPTFKHDIPIELIFEDHDFNVREATSYGRDANKLLYENLKEMGIDPTKPMMAFHQLPDGRLKTLRGHLRLSCIRAINDEDVAADKPPRFKILPGMIYTGLKPNEEILIMADHTGTKELNPAELAKMIGMASEARGWTDKVGARMFGIDPNKVQRLRQTYMMPPVLDDLYKQCHGDETALVIGQTELSALYKGYTADFNVNGIPRDTSGPHFNDAWKAMLEQRDLKGKGEKPVKAKNGQEIDGAIASIGAEDHPIENLVRDTLAWVNGKQIALLTITRTAHDKWDLLDAEAKKYHAELTDARAIVIETERELRELRADIANLQADLDRSAEREAELATELATLREQVQV